MIMQEEILEASEVARMLRINVRTVQKMASNGELTGFRVANRWRFRREAINDYIRQQEQLNFPPKNEEKPE